MSIFFTKPYSKDRPKIGTNEFIQWFFLNVTKQANGCWRWRNCSEDKYGMVMIDGQQHVASRLSYEIFVGKIPKGLLVCHKCDKRHCVNPEHLFVGTYADNVHDCISKGRAKSPGVPRKLNEKQVREICLLLIRTKNKKQEWIARKFDISYSMVCSIARGRTWRKVSSEFLPKIPSRFLAEKEVLQIRKQLAAGKPQIQIIKETGLSQTVVSHIANGRTWKGVL